MFYESEPFWRQATSASPTVLGTKRNLLAWFTEIFLAWHLLQVKLDPGAQMISAESVYLWALLPSALAVFSVRLSPRGGKMAVSSRLHLPGLAFPSRKTVPLG